MKVNKIYNESCLVTMSNMPDNFLDLTVTSPPYDNLRTYNNDIDKSWGEHIWKPIIKELYRVTKDGGVVVWVVNDATINGSETLTSFKQAIYANECGFRQHDTMIYYRETPYPESNRYAQVFEHMFVWSKGKPKTFNKYVKNFKAKSSINRKECKSNSFRCKDGKMVKATKKQRDRLVQASKNILKHGENIWYIPAGYGISTTDKVAFKHPAIFPEELANRHIMSWSNENDIVYDPFCGSGTVPKMAILNNRNYIGSELSKEYCDNIIAKRIELANKIKAQQKLF